TDKSIEQIKAMIKAVDIETGQILISAKIIEISDGNLRNLGIQWGLFGKVNGADIGAKHVSPGTDLDPQSITGANVVSNVLDKISYGVVTRDRLQVALEYLFQNNKAEVVAEPSITTLDNKEARIFMGSQLPLTTKDIAGNTVVKLIEAGTELITTPHITDGKRVMLQLNAKKESANADQSLSTQSATTNVVVNDGETVVIAGLTSNQMTETETGIPVLKDIPIIGYLFKTKEKKLTKQNLIIFVTPHIVQKNIQTATPSAK
ncbi:MAG: hypothetical protein PHC61_08380, partial [Chitinivibrionales bacterium]|nr:hypothetical protein [Chitinivibrionales bacterium]